jgi:hypothetical protein
VRNALSTHNGGGGKTQKAVGGWVCLLGGTERGARTGEGGEPHREERRASTLSIPLQYFATHHTQGMEWERSV